MMRCFVNKLREGLDIAVITDAGTPGISDPGEELVRQCYEAGINVTSLPGACACITALTMSGQPTRRFAFEAFLPYDKKERAQILENLRNETRTIIIYKINCLIDFVVLMIARHLCFYLKMIEKLDTISRIFCRYQIHFF